MTTSPQYASESWHGPFDPDLVECLCSVDPLLYLIKGESSEKAKSSATRDGENLMI
jgi:hypothetical protein